LFFVFLSFGAQSYKKYLKPANPRCKYFIYLIQRGGLPLFPGGFSENDCRTFLGTDYTDYTDKINKKKNVKAVKSV